MQAGQGMEYDMELYIYISIVWRYFKPERLCFSGVGNIVTDKWELIASYEYDFLSQT